MVRKSIFLAVAVFLTVCFSFSCVSAQEKAEDAKSKLNDLRKEMTRIKYDYQQEMQKANKTCDNKVNALREDFHKARTACLEERKQKVDELTKVYKEKIKPMEAEEKTLLETLAPAGGMNFVKPKPQKTK